MGDIALRGNRLTAAKGGRIGLPSKRKDFKTHGKDIPTMAAKGGRIGLQYGGPPNRGRTNLLEQLGRVEGERSNPNRRAEISRVHGELNRGYAKGGRAGHAYGSVVKGITKLAKKFKKKKVYPETEDLTHQKGPYVGDVGSEKRVKKAHGMSAVKKAIKKVTEPKGVFKPKGVKGKGSDELRANLKGLRSKRRTFKTHGKDVPTMAAEGGRIGLRTGSRGPSAGQRIKARKARSEEWWTGKRGKHQAVYSPSLDTKLREKRPHSTPEGRWRDIKAAYAKSRSDRIQTDVAKFKRTAPSGRALHKEGGRIGLKKGGNGKWMQKVSASIKKRGTKGKCTPITKPGCTGRAKALAKTFKKIAAKRKA